jgi:hypothetical protein
VQLSRGIPSTEGGLALWLNRKMTDAELDGDLQRLNRYQAFYTCLTTGDCQRLSALGGPGGGFAWKQVGVGDCGGQDIACSAGAGPSDVECNAKRVGLTSVCWTGGANKGYPPFPGCQGDPADWCTYKSVTPEACKGGGRPGEMWVCTQDVNQSDQPCRPKGYNCSSSSQCCEGLSCQFRKGQTSGTCE